MSGSPPSDRPPAERAAASLDAREAARAGRRDALLAAAEAVFAESGFAGAKMAEIAARAGYSAGHLYNVFESKEALFAELLVRRGGALVARIEAALLGAGGARGGLERLVEAVLRAVEEQRAFFVMLTEVTPNLEWAGPREEGRALRERLESLVRDWIERGMAAGEIPPGDGGACACVVQGALNRYVARWLQRGADARTLRVGAEAVRDVLARALGVGA